MHLPTYTYVDVNPVVLDVVKVACCNASTAYSETA